MNVLKYIDWRFLLASFIVGLGMLYFVVPPSRRVFVYPSPENVEQLLYRDKGGTCFRWTAKEVNCPTDPHDIAAIPPQV
jgi:hypothetical protein